MESQDDQLQLLGDSESEYQFDKKTPRRLILSVRSRFQNNPALLAVLLLLLYIAVLSTIHTFKPFVPRRDDCHGMNCRDCKCPLLPLIRVVLLTTSSSTTSEQHRI